LYFGIDGDGQLSALSWPVFPNDCVSSVFIFPVLSAAMICLNGSLVHGCAAGCVVAEVLALGEDDADGVPEAEFDEEDDADFEDDALLLPEVGAVSGRAAASLPDLLAALLVDVLAELDGVLETEPEGVPVAEPVVDPDGLLLGVAAGCPQVISCAGAITPRKFSTAALPSCATSAVVPFGISTTSWSVPCTTTVAPVTP